MRETKDEDHPIKILTKKYQIYSFGYTKFQNTPVKREITNKCNYFSFERNSEGVLLDRQSDQNRVRGESKDVKRSFVCNIMVRDTTSLVFTLCLVLF